MDECRPDDEPHDPSEDSETDVVQPADSDRPLLRVWSRREDGYTTKEREITFDYLNLHNYCAVFPFQPPQDDSDVAEIDDRDKEHVDIQFVSGFARTGLRHLPIIMLATTLIFFGSAEFVDHVNGLSVFFPTLSPLEITGLALGVLAWIGMIAIVAYVEILDIRELYKIGVVYGLLLFLAGGTVLSIALVVFNDPQELEPNIVFISGYLFMLFLGGLYVYDGMLRTEFLIENLDRTAILGTNGHSVSVPVNDSAVEAYTKRKKKLKNRFEHTIPAKGRIRVRTAYIFSVLLVSQFAVGWLVGRGPQNLDFNVTLLGNIFFNIFLTVIAFQFVILVNWFYRLINDDILDGQTTLTYRPFHPDGRGGYRDLGNFATRITVLFIIGGFYCIYRLAVQGSRATSEDMVASLEPLVGPVDPLIGQGLWLLSFVGPMVVYVIAVIIWFYYTFWQMHLRMAREREQRYTEQTYKQKDTSFDDDLNWEIRTGPVWPIDQGRLVSLVTGSIGPLIPLIDIFLLV